MFGITPTQDQIDTALAAFLQSMLGSTVVIQMQVNRTPEPPDVNYVAINQVSRPRLATNIDSFTDVSLEGSIATTGILTATSVDGVLVPGLPLIGADVVAGSVLGAQITGPAGGAGTYNVAPAQLVTTQLITAGTKQSLQKAEVVMQLDVHGPDSADNVQFISTLFRDGYGVDFFSGQGVDVAPLYCSDPRQLPFDNAEEQWETRWSIDLHMEGNFVVFDLPQQFAHSLELDVISVEAAYPAA